MQGIAHSVFVDANVHFSRACRDWIGLLCTHPADPVFHVYWTEDVVAEVIAHLREKNPQWDGRRIRSIREKFEGAYSGYRVDDFTIDGTYPGSDPKDAHVHAAATACVADYLITRDRGFFWEDAQTCYEVLTPDEFFCELAASHPQLVHEVTLRQLEHWYRRDHEVDLPSQLRRAECPRFADVIRRHLRAPDAEQVLRRAASQS